MFSQTTSKFTHKIEGISNPFFSFWLVPLDLCPQCVHYLVLYLRLLSSFTCLDLCARNLRIKQSPHLHKTIGRLEASGCPFILSGSGLHCSVFRCVEFSLSFGNGMAITKCSVSLEETTFVENIHLKSTLEARSAVSRSGGRMNTWIVHQLRLSSTWRLWNTGKWLSFAFYNLHGRS